MHRIIQNINGKAEVKTSFRGREIVLKPKHTMSIDWEDEEHRALYHHLLSTYKFVIDRTTIHLKSSVEEETVKLQTGFHQDLMDFIASKAPAKFVKRIIYTDDSITIKWGKGK